MKRLMIAAIVPVCLTGCLPIPIAIATTSLGGLAFLTTGKSSTDHLISATFEKDCAMYRVMTEGEMCQDIGPNGEGRTIAVIETSYPGEGQDWVPDPLEEAYYGELTAEQQEELQKTKDAEGRYEPLPYPQLLKEMETELASSFVPHPRKLDVDAVIDQVGNTKTVVSAAGWDYRQNVSLPSTNWDHPDEVEAGAASDAGVEIPKGTNLVPSSVVSDDIAPAVKAIVVTPADSRLAVERLDKSEREAAIRDEDRFLVVGSFRQPWRAHKLAARFSDQNAQIYKANIEEVVWRRVVIGPLSPAEAKAMKLRLAKVDGKKPWITSGLKTDLLASLN